MIESPVANAAVVRPTIQVYRGCRPYVEVAAADPQRRRAWFESRPLESLPTINPRLLIGWIVATVVLLVASPLVGLVVGAAGAGYLLFMSSSKKKALAANNVGIEATARSIMHDERSAAGSRAAFEMMPLGLNIDRDEWQQAQENGHVLFSFEAPKDSVTWVDRYPIAPRATVRIAGAIASGLVDYTVAYNAIDDRLDWQESGYRTIPWDRVSMVTNSTSCVSVETTGGTQMRLYLDNNNRMASEAGIVVLGQVHGNPDAFCRSIVARSHRLP